MSKNSGLTLTKIKGDYDHAMTCLLSSRGTRLIILSNKMDEQGLYPDISKLIRTMGLACGRFIKTAHYQYDFDFVKGISLDEKIFVTNWHDKMKLLRKKIYDSIDIFLSKDAEAKLARDTNKEIEEAISLLRAYGYTVTEPSK